VALAGPGREQEQNFGTLVGLQGMALVRLEMSEGPRGRGNLLVAGPDAGVSVDDEDPRVLLDLVVSELLARLEADQNRAGLVFAHQNDRRAAAVRRLDLAQIPGFHGAAV
jgi:hypothetical protein